MQRTKIIKQNSTYMHPKLKSESTLQTPSFSQKGIGQESAKRNNVLLICTKVRKKF